MKQKVLSFSVIVAGLCSIVYELLVSATATYFLGDGVKQFSILIGVYLFSMGVGAYFSKYFKNKSLNFFIRVEYLLGIIGGLSVPILYFLFVNVSSQAFQYYCILLMGLIGFLTGSEVPLLAFAFKDDEIKDNLSNILSLDYIGGLLATLLFPFILLPLIGLFYSSLLFGIVNILLGLMLNFLYLKKQKKLFVLGIISIIMLLILVFYTGKLLKVWDEEIYKSPIVENIQTPYQKIVLTSNKYDDTRLYLNRVIQFSSLDEHRYHESLVHIPLVLHKNPERVLILGGGENLASREVLKHEQVKHIDVVDIDEKMFELAKNNKYITDLNQNAANNPKVNLVLSDAFAFLNENEVKYDVVIADLPDPANESLARLYSKQFFLLVKRNLKSDGIMVTQSGEIYYSNQVFSCIKNTVSNVFPYTETFHTYIPSFGDWGFTIASNQPFINSKPKPLPKDLRYLSQADVLVSFGMPKDIKIVDTSVNTLDHPIILNYFLSDWERWKVDFGKSTN